MAVNTFVGTTSSNWGTLTNWSLGSVPTASDGHVTTFSNLSPNCTVDASSKVCNALDFTAGTGYVNTITMSNQITVSGNVTLNADMTIASSGALIINTTSTLISNGKIWPNALLLTSNVTYTLSDNWDADGLLTLGLSATIINGSQITASAGLTLNMSTGTVSGTTNIILDGTGTITGATSTGALRNNLTINTSGTITINNANNFNYNTGTLTYIAGTVVTTGATLLVTLATTLAVSGITWDNVTFNAGTFTITFTENLNLTGLLLLGSGAFVLTLNGLYTINAGGGLSQGGTTSIITGTMNIKMTGTGTITGTNSSGVIRNNFTIDAGAGTSTFAAVTFNFNTGTFTWTSGTVVITSGAILNNQGVAATFNTSTGITWYNVTLTGSVTVTFSSNFSLSNLLTLGTTTNALILTGSTINILGGLTYGGTIGSVSGTTILNLTGTQTVQAPSASSGSVQNPITINAPGGTVTFAAKFLADLSKLMLTAGTVITTSGTWASSGTGGLLKVGGMRGGMQY